MILQLTTMDMSMVQDIFDPLSPSRYSRLRAAAIELRFLLSHNYPRKSSVEFVGNHHQLNKDERNILFRGVFTAGMARAIKDARIPLSGLRGGKLVIDGYNVTITLENAMKNKPLIKGNDGFIRDISGTFRGFRQSDLTRKAWELIMDILNDYPPKHVVVLLDRPYSRSAILARSINAWLEMNGLDGEATLSDGVDHYLQQTKGVRATSDSSILINGSPSVDLAGHIATRRLNRRPFIVP